jgi:hypothetical protein
MATTQDKIYAAGFFDGEGNVCLIKPSGSRSRPSYRLLSVNVTQASKPVIDWFQSLWGGGVHYRKPTGRTKKPAWQISITGVRAERFLEDILPYLKVKKESAAEKLNRWKSRPNQRPWISLSFEARAQIYPLSKGVAVCQNRL